MNYPSNDLWLRKHSKNKQVNNLWSKCPIQKDDFSEEKSADKSINELIIQARLTFGHHNLALTVLYLTMVLPTFFVIVLSS